MWHDYSPNGHIYSVAKKAPSQIDYQIDYLGRGAGIV